MPFGRVWARRMRSRSMACCKAHSNNNRLIRIQIQTMIQMVRAPVQIQTIIQMVRAPVQIQMMIQMVRAPVQIQMMIQMVRAPVRIQTMIQMVRAPVRIQMMTQMVRTPVQLVRALLKALQPVTHSVMKIFSAWVKHWPIFMSLSIKRSINMLQ